MKSRSYSHQTIFTWPTIKSRAYNQQQICQKWLDPHCGLINFWLRILNKQNVLSLLELQLFLLVTIPDWIGWFYTRQNIGYFIYQFFLKGAPEGLHDGVDDDEDEGYEEVEEKPDVYHLQIGGVGQAVIHLCTNINVSKPSFGIYNQYWWQNKTSFKMFKQITTNKNKTWTIKAVSTSIDVRLMPTIDSK